MDLVDLWRRSWNGEGERALEVGGGKGVADNGE